MQALYFILHHGFRRFLSNQMSSTHILCDMKLFFLNSLKFHVNLYKLLLPYKIKYLSMQMTEIIYWFSLFSCGRRALVTFDSAIFGKHVLFWNSISPFILLFKVFEFSCFSYFLFLNSELSYFSRHDEWDWEEPQCAPAQDGEGDVGSSDLPIYCRKRHRCQEQSECRSGKNSRILVLRWCYYRMHHWIWNFHCSCRCP